MSVHVELPDIQTPRLFEIKDNFFDWFYRRPVWKIGEDLRVPDHFFQSGSSTWIDLQNKGKNIDFQTPHSMKGWQSLQRFSWGWNFNLKPQDCSIVLSLESNDDQTIELKNKI